MASMTSPVMRRGYYYNPVLPARQACTWTSTARRASNLGTIITGAPRQRRRATPAGRRRPQTAIYLFSESYFAWYDLAGNLMGQQANPGSQGKSLALGSDWDCLRQAIRRPRPSFQLSLNTYVPNATGGLGLELPKRKTTRFWGSRCDGPPASFTRLSENHLQVWDLCSGGPAGTATFTVTQTPGGHFSAPPRTVTAVAHGPRPSVTPAALLPDLGQLPEPSGRQRR